jgi:hypothetical protein
VIFVKSKWTSMLCLRVHNVMHIGEVRKIFCTTMFKYYILN